MLALGAAVKVAAPAFSVVNIEPDAAAFYSDHFAQQLRGAGVSVITAPEVSAIVGLERSKQLLGCEDNSASCFTELANALGADALVVGSVGKFDQAYQVNVKIIRASDARAYVTRSARAHSEGELLDALARMAREAAEVLGVGTTGKSRAPAWIAAAVVLASGITAALCFANARSEYIALEQPPPMAGMEVDYATAVSYKSSGPVLLGGGIVAGVISLAAAAALFIFLYKLNQS
jgi:hypothetical protein